MADTDAVLDERASTYGKFIDNARIAQELKSVYVDHFRLKQFEPDQREAIDMICSKLARILNGDPNHIDNWVDIAGYATLVTERLKGNKI